MSILDPPPSTFPLNSEIDNVTNYVSAVPLKELGLGLGVEHLSDEQAQELTGDYSLPALKVRPVTSLAAHVRLNFHFHDYSHCRLSLEASRP